MPKIGRSPCGERGLKYATRVTIRLAFWSLPVRGAWIEIISRIFMCVFVKVAPRAGSVD